MSDSLQPHGLQHTRLLCPLLSPRVCSDSYQLNWWCYLTISFSAARFSFCLQSFPASAFSSELALHIRWPKDWSFSFSNSPFNEYSGLTFFRINWFALPAVPGIPRVISSTIIWKHQFFGTLPSSWFKSHIHTWQLEKPQFWLYEALSVKWCLCFLMCYLDLSQLSFQGASLLISWLQSLPTVILESKKIKSVTASSFSPFICH